MQDYTIEFWKIKSRGKPDVKIGEAKVRAADLHHANVIGEAMADNMPVSYYHKVQTNDETLQTGI